MIFKVYGFFFVNFGGFFLIAREFRMI